MDVEITSIFPTEQAMAVMEVAHGKDHPFLRGLRKEIGQKWRKLCDFFLSKLWRAGRFVLMLKKVTKTTNYVLHSYLAVYHCKDLKE